MERTTTTNDQKRQRAFDPLTLLFKTIPVLEKINRYGDFAFSIKATHLKAVYYAVMGNKTTRAYFKKLKPNKKPIEDVRDLLAVFSNHYEGCIIELYDDELHITSNDCDPFCNYINISTMPVFKRYAPCTYQFLCHIAAMINLAQNNTQEIHLYDGCKEMYEEIILNQYMDEETEETEENIKVFQRNCRKIEHSSFVKDVKEVQLSEVPSLPCSITEGHLLRLQFMYKKAKYIYDNKKQIDKVDTHLLNDDEKIHYKSSIIFVASDNILTNEYINTINDIYNNYGAKTPRSYWLFTEKGAQLVDIFDTQFHTYYNSLGQLLQNLSFSEINEIKYLEHNARR